MVCAVGANFFSFDFLERETPFGVPPPLEFQIISIIKDIKSNSNSNHKSNIKHQTSKAKESQSIEFHFFLDIFGGFFGACSFFFFFGTYQIILDSIRIQVQFFGKSSIFVNRPLIVVS